jgi:hypothetical protein
MSYDDKQQQVFGRLATDRPHVVKAQATYDLPWGTTVGVFGILETGTPVTEEFTYQGYPIYVNGRGNLGRYPTYSQIDLNLAHEFRLGGNKRLTLQWNIVNLFDFKTATVYYSTNHYRDGVYPDASQFFDAPWSPSAVVSQFRADGQTIRDEQLFKVPTIYQGAREMRLQAKFSF